MTSAEHEHEYHAYDEGQHIRYINKKTGEVSTGIITEYLGGPTMHYVNLVVAFDVSLI